VVSRLDGHLFKARITIQISPSGRLSVLAWTREQLIWKLPIQIQPSGRLPLMVRTRAYSIWKLRVEELPFGHSSPMVRTREALDGNYLQRTCDCSDVSVSPSGRCSQTGKIFSGIFKKSCRTVASPDGVRTYYSSRPFCTSAYK
jgi:hypothetical protein